LFIVSKLITPDITQYTTHFNSWHSLSPIHPTPDEQQTTRQTYHSWKLKYGNIPKSIKEDLDLNAASILPTLKDILKITKNPPPQA